MVVSRRGARPVARSIAAQARASGIGSERMAVMSERGGQGDVLGNSQTRLTLSRRAWLIGGGSVAATLVGAGLVRRWRGERASVFIAKNQSYHGDLVRTTRDGL